MYKTAIVWSQANCPACSTAYNMLLKAGYYIEERKVGVNTTREEFFEANPGAKSVPQIYLDGELVPGGLVGLKDMLG